MKKEKIKEEELEEKEEVEETEEVEQKEEVSEETGEKDKFGRTLHKATCSECGKETEVPFKPSGDRPIYCRDCYQKHRPKKRF